MPKDIEKRVAELEKRVESIVRNQNKVNQKGRDILKNDMQELNKINQKAHVHITELEKRVESIVRNQNKVNQKGHDHIAKLEKRLAKLEKGH